MQPMASRAVSRARVPPAAFIRPATRVMRHVLASKTSHFQPHRPSPHCLPPVSASLHTSNRLSASDEPATTASTVGKTVAHFASDGVGHVDTIILDGKTTADAICDDIQRLVQHYQTTSHNSDRPGLAVIIVGDRRDSLRYVQRKTEQANRLGFHSRLLRFPQSATTQQLLTAIDELNGDEKVHGVLVQLPLPDHVEQNRVLERVCIEKDVDGFHPYNMGLLALNWKGAGKFVPWEKVHRTIEVSAAV